MFVRYGDRLNDSMSVPGHGGGRCSANSDASCFYKIWNRMELRGIEQKCNEVLDTDTVLMRLFDNAVDVEYFLHCATNNLTVTEGNLKSPDAVTHRR